MDYKDRFTASLLAAAVGDAMGAATETFTQDMIRERFGGPVHDILTPGDDVFAHGFPRGSVTDDFSLAYSTAQAIIKHNGRVDEETAADALLSWAETPYYSMAGPTTRAAVNRLKGEETTSFYDFLSVDNSKASNGGAMKIAPVGLNSFGDTNKAIVDAIMLCLPTHNNSTALAAACAVSCAISAALKDNATVDDMIRFGCLGAEAGEEFGIKTGVALACPSVRKRIMLAVSIAEKHKGNMDETMRELADIIGCGLAAAEAVPTAFGILKACEGRTMEGIYAGVNIGNDTDTIATIVGAMCGALNGTEPGLMKYLPLIDEVNGFDIEKTAAAMAELPHE